MFSFKEFTIKQERCAMKVGTDGVLLGAWARVDGEERNILDIGSGTGLISIMMAQRSCANITGVEIDTDSYSESLDNVGATAWSDRINIVHSDIQSFKTETRFDIIVSNPPFFRESLKSSNISRTTARHTDSLSFEELIKAAKRLLSPEGHFNIVLPIEQSRSFDIESCGVLYLARRCAVITEQGKQPKRYLSEYRLTPSTQIIREELVIRNQGVYSDSYRALTAQFYKE